MRSLAALPFGVLPLAPMIRAAAAGLVLVARVALWVPAFRAMRVAPVEVLRYA